MVAAETRVVVAVEIVLYEGVNANKDNNISTIKTINLGY